MAVQFGPVTRWIIEEIRYELRDGQWWLLRGDKPVWPLGPEELAWHIERDHAPFVIDGIDKHDPLWWDYPRIKDCSHAECDIEVSPKPESRCRCCMRRFCPAHLERGEWYDGTEANLCWSCYNKKYKVQLVGDIGAR